MARLLGQISNCEVSSAYRHGANRLGRPSDGEGVVGCDVRYSCGGLGTQGRLSLPFVSAAESG
jgi:hypothetical protein